MYLFSGSLEGLTETEKEEKINKIDKKITVYNTISSVSLGFVDPYKIETKQRLKLAKKEQIKLEKAVDKFASNLKGTYKGSNQATFYGNILQELPDAMVENVEFGTLVDKLKTYSGNSSSGKGLVEEERSIKEKSIFLADFDDALEKSIGDYSSKINKLKIEIESINELVEDESEKYDLVEERNKKGREIRSYERELEKLEDVREQIFDELTDMQMNYEFVNSTMNVEKVILANTKDSLRHLKFGIKKMEHFVQGKDQSLVYSDHIIMAKRAKSKGVKLLGGAGIGDVVLKGQLQSMVDDTTTGSAIYKTNGTDYAGIAAQIKNEQKETIADFKRQVRKSQYN
jgi:hypothetical protein